MYQHQKIIFDAYCKLTATRRELQDNWICDQTLLRLLDAHYPSLKNTFDFTRGRMVRALSAYAPPTFHSQNEHGVFSKQFQTSCPYDGTKRRRVTYFYRQLNGKPPADPVSVRDITDVHAGRILVTSASPDRGTGGRVITTLNNNQPDNDDDEDDDNDDRMRMRTTTIRGRG